MIIIPAIDLKGGNCVRLFQGKAEERTVYFDDPKEAALKLISDDAKRIHVVDLDGAFRGKEGSPNRRIIGEVAALSEVPIEVGGGIRTMEDAEELLEVGVRWVILGTVHAHRQHQGPAGRPAGEADRRPSFALRAHSARPALEGLLPP